MPIDIDDVITINRPFSGSVDTNGEPIEDPINLKVITTRRNIQSARVTLNVEPVTDESGRPVLDEHGNHVQRLLSLALVLDIPGHEIIIGSLDQFEGNRLQNFYAFVDEVVAIIGGTIDSPIINYKSADDFPP